MKTISTDLTNFLLDNVNFNRSDLVTIVLPNGQVLNVFYGNNVTSITYPAGLAASITVGGTDYPWSTSDPTYPFSGTGGAGAASLAMTQGQVITLQYASGTVNGYDASGGNGIPSTSCPGNYIAPVAPLISLIGGFANSSNDLIAPPFFVGNNAVIGPAPANTTQLLMGVNDLSYGSNSGSWVMNIVPPAYYSSKYGSWERGPFTNKASFKLSTEVLKLTGFIPETVLFPGTTTPLMQSIINGALNGSKVIIQTLFWPVGSPPSSGFSMGTMQLTIGQIGNVKNTGRSKIECDVYDLTYILNRPFPPHMIQSSCRHTFCDAGCTLLANNFRTTPYALASTSTILYLDFSIPGHATSTAYKYGNLILTSSVLYMCTVAGSTAGSSPTYNSTRGLTTVDGSATFTSMGSIATTEITLPSGASTQSFPLGYVVGVTGQNAGIKRTIKAQETSSGSLPEMQLLWPLPFPVTAGDTFYMIAGCDKTLPTCETIYNNELHFGGEPLVPNPEIAS